MDRPAVQPAGLTRLWADTHGDPRVTIAILDGVVDQADRSLHGARLDDLDAWTTGAPAGDSIRRHGTQVASILFGQGHGTVRGIAPGSRGLIIPVFSGDGTDAPLSCTEIDLAHAITQAVAAGAQVINISGGRPLTGAVAHALLVDAVRLATTHGAVVVAAAGNEGRAAPDSPGSLPGVLAVGATDRHGAPWGTSEWDRRHTDEGVLAPGDGIVVTDLAGGATTVSGTSFATAIVSGVAALLLSAQLRRGRAADAAAVRAAILGTARQCDPATEGCGPGTPGVLDVLGAYARVTRTERSLTARSAVVAPPVRVGDRAPQFAVPDHTGSPVLLSQYLGRKVVLWFFPRADTPG